LGRGLLGRLRERGDEILDLRRDRRDLLGVVRRGGLQLRDLLAHEIALNGGVALLARETGFDDADDLVEVRKNELTDH
jgi:hypothetical protein